MILQGKLSVLSEKHSVNKWIKHPMRDHEKEEHEKWTSLLVRSLIERLGRPLYHYR